MSVKDTNNKHIVISSKRGDRPWSLNLEFREDGALACLKCTFPRQGYSACRFTPFPDVTTSHFIHSGRGFSRGSNRGEETTPDEVKAIRHGQAIGDDNINKIVSHYFTLLSSIFG
jgi:hypothetical protein